MSNLIIYLVILVDRKKVMMFTLLEGFAVGRYKEIVLDDVPQKVRVDEEDYYGRSDKVFRHIEDHLHRHLQKVAGFIDDFVRREKIDGVFLGGHTDMFPKVKKYLPLSLRKNIKATFITDLKAPFNEILEDAKQTVKAFEHDTSFIFTSR